jgi:hypothetical protein
MLFDKDPRTLSIMNNSKEHPKEKNREWNQINHFISNPHNSMDGFLGVSSRHLRDLTI